MGGKKGDGKFKDERRLRSMLEELYRAPDTPALIQLVAGGRDYLSLCRTLANPVSAAEKQTFSRAAKIMAAQGKDLRRLTDRLHPVACALGLADFEEGRPDYYAILGIGRDARQAEIKAAYRRQARRLHPDTSSAGGEGDSRAFVELHAAYQALSNPGLRRSYDQSNGCREGDWYEYVPASEEDRPEDKGRGSARRTFVLLMILAGLFVALAFVLDAGFKEKALFEEPLVLEGGGRQTAGPEEEKPVAAADARPRRVWEELAQVSRSRKSQETPQPAAEAPKRPVRPVPAERPAGRRDEERNEGVAVARPAAALEQEVENLREELLIAEFAAQTAAARAKASAVKSRTGGEAVSDRSAAQEPPDELSEPGRQRKPGEAEARAEQEQNKELSEIDRIKSFLAAYVETYESRDMDAFEDFFAPDATDNGRPFRTLLPQYRARFAGIEKVRYAIVDREYTLRAGGAAVTVEGVFQLDFKTKSQGWEKSRGRIAIELKKAGDSFLLQALRYSYDKEEESAAGMRLQSFLKWWKAGRRETGNVNREP